MPTEEVIAKAKTKVLGHMLVEGLQLLVGHSDTRRKGECRAVLVVPERIPISIDGFLSLAADQTVRSNVVVLVDILGNDLVELWHLSVLNSVYSFRTQHTSMGRLLKAVSFEGP